MTEILKHLLYGWIILVVAILANVAANSIGFKTWYDFLKDITSLGIKTAFTSLSVPGAIYLFIIYPGIFGLIIYLISKTKI